MKTEKSRRSVPRFVTEGWALYPGGEYYIAEKDGLTIILGKKTGLNFIGIRPDAPEWAKQEYAEWITPTQI
jgi:hypothetical protein